MQQSPKEFAECQRASSNRYSKGLDFLSRFSPLTIYTKKWILIPKNVISKTDRYGAEMMFTAYKMKGQRSGIPILSFPVAFIIILLLMAFFPGTAPLTASGTPGGGPRLVWTGEDGCHTDGLEPDLGLTSTKYDFRIMYLDDQGGDPLDEQAGHYIHLILGNDVDDINSTYEMTTVDNEYSDGSIFNISMDGLNPGQYRYFFELKVRNTSYRLPASGYIEAPYVNTNPTLYPAPGIYKERTVYPEMGNTTDLFTFQILYSDADDHPPAEGAFARGVYIDNVFHKMESAPGSGKYGNGDFKDGELYRFTTKLEQGDHRYYFQFTDEKGGTATSEVYEDLTVITGFPDLMVKMDGSLPDIQWDLLSSDPKDWDTVTITAAIENDGGSDIPQNESFYVDLEVYYIDPFTGDAILEEKWAFKNTGLAVGKEHVITTGYSPYSVGVYELRVIVDKDNDIRELIEFHGNHSPSNNIAKVRFKVGSDLSVSSSDIMPISTYNKNDLISSVTIHNTGPTDALLVDDLTVVFKLGDEEKIGLIPKNTKISAGKTYKVGVDFYMSTDKDEVNISVSVDLGRVLKEAINPDSINNNNNADSQIKVVTRTSRYVSSSFQPPVLLVIAALTGLALLTCRDRNRNTH